MISKFKFSLLFLLISLNAFAQAPDTLTPEKNARWKIGRIRDNTVRAITPQNFRDAFTSLANVAVSRVPNMTMKEARQGKADTARSISIIDKFRSGIFIRDDSDASTADDSAMTIIANGKRYKRPFVGMINPEWFGFSETNADNSAALKKAVRYLELNGALGSQGGVVMIPAGYFRFTKSVNVVGFNITIRGHGLKTTLAVDDSLEYLIKFDSPGVRGEGGGITDLRIAGNGKLKYAAKLNAWRKWEFKRLLILDNLNACLDAYNDYTTYSEAIHVENVERKRSSGSNAFFARHHIIFRPGTTGSIADSWINHCIFLDADSTGIILDGTDRVDVNEVHVANNSTIQALGLRITNTTGLNPDAGKNTVRNFYFEMQAPGGAPSNSFAVLIDSPLGNTGFNRYNVITDLRVTRNTSLNTQVGWVKLRNLSAAQFLCGSNKLKDFRGEAGVNGYIDIGDNVSDTDIRHTATTNSVYRILDQGYKTVVNGVQNWTGAGAYGIPPVNRTDVGRMVYNTEDKALYAVVRDGTLTKISNNAYSGTATLAAGTVTISNPRVTATSQILVTVQETGQFNGRIRVSARVAGTSFTVTSTDNTDNCVIAWQVIN